MINRNLVALAGVVFIDMAGIGLIVPVMPSLIQTLTGGSLDHAATLGGWLLFTYAAMQFVFAPVIGGLSDRFGRRPVLLTTLALLGVDYALMAAAPTIAWLFAGRLVSGIMGASHAAANSCLADSIAPEKRGAAFGMLGGAGAAGFVLGPALGGIIGQFGDRLPFVAAALLCAAGVVFGWINLKETLDVSQRRRFDPWRSNPFGAVARMRGVPLVRGCLAAIFLMQLASQSQLSVWAYYGTLSFNWTPAVTGMTVALFGSLLVLTQGVLSGRTIARFGPVNTATISLAFTIPSFAVLAFAPNTSVVVIGIVIGAMAGMCFPALQQLMTVRIPHDAQGELQGAIASIVSLTAIIGPPVMTGVFAAYADDRGPVFPGAPFLLAAGLSACAVLVLVMTLARHGGKPAAP